MLFDRRALAACVVVLLALPGPVSAKDKPAHSSLNAIGLDVRESDIVVTIEGTKAPDFTSFTMSDPFRVVVDWAGSTVDKAEPDKSWERGLVRRILTKQFSSEAEKISRVTIELARETSYHVEADGNRVRVHFVPVADPIPEPQPVKVAEQPAPAEKVVAVQQGPLTEPDLPVPAELAPMKKPAPVIAKVEPAKPAEKPVAVAAAAAPKAAATPVPAPAPVVLATNAPKAVPAPAPAPEKPAPALEKPAPVVAAAKAPEPKPAQPVKLATLTPPAPVAPETKPVTVVAAKAPEAPPTMKAPAPVPTRDSNASTQRLASAAPRPDGTSTGWTPPGVAPTARERGAQRELPVVKLGASPAPSNSGNAIAQETIKPAGSTPADADVDDGPAPSADANDFDPGPRVMKYIGFQQMADVSRVFVRLDGKAKFKQVKEGGKVVIELVNTSINVKNNERPLDTTYFNSPVSKVQAVRSGENTKVEISLREGVPFTVKRIGTTIAVDFKRAG